jgi:hypothetical protein
MCGRGIKFGLESDARAGVQTEESKRGSKRLEEGEDDRVCLVRAAVCLFAWRVCGVNAGRALFCV